MISCRVVNKVEEVKALKGRIKELEGEKIAILELLGTKVYQAEVLLEQNPRQAKVYKEIIEELEEIIEFIENQNKK